MISVIDLLCHRYERSTVALKELEKEMEVAKRTMQKMRQNGDMVGLGRVRMDADMLAKSIHVTQKDVDRCEETLANQFFDHKPLDMHPDDEVPGYTY